MRPALVFGVLLSLALVLALPSPSRASSCGETECGVPHCWEPTVRVRADMTRAVSVQCRGATSARLVTAPAHVEVSNVSTDWYGLHFDARPDEDLRRVYEAVFEIDGHEGSIEQRVNVEVVPRSENSAPVCDGDRATVRSDGSGPVDVFLHPFCRDPDGDDFVIRGGPPGEHPQSPKTVPSGSTDSNWPYRTATFSGTETATIWATDSLGARSEDAQLEVTVGPEIDAPPECYGEGDGSTVWSRPGQIRRFPIICADADADLFTTTLSSPPERGLMPLFVESLPRYGWWGVERWIDATYVPTDDSLERDHFSVTPSGLKGSGPERYMAIVPRPLPANGGGGCGWWPGDVTSGVPGALRLACDDEEGDPLSVEILTEPRHGTLGPPVVTPGPYGGFPIAIPYVSNVGYDGYDCVKVRVTDGHGLVFDLTIDINVRPLPVEVELPPPVVDVPQVPEEPAVPGVPEVEAPADVPAPPDVPAVPPVGDVPTPPDVPAPPDVPTPPDVPAPPDVPTPPDVPPPPDVPHAPAVPRVPATPSVPTAPTTSVANSLPPLPPPPPLPTLPSGSGKPAPKVRAVVEQALGTRAVKRLRSTGGAQLWARSNLSRRDLLRWGRAPGLVVVCATRCQIRADSKLATGLRSIRPSRGKAALAAMARQPQVLSLAISPAERRALRRGRKARAQFKVSIRGERGRAQSRSRWIPVSR